MARIKWDEVGARTFEAGVTRGVLYIPDDTGAFVNGVPWNGLISVKETRSDAGSAPYYIDGVKYIDLPAATDYKATLEAFTYPDEFLPFDGVGVVGNGMFLDNQIQKVFGLSYRSGIGNDIDGTSHAYKLHIVYNLTATPADRAYETWQKTVAPQHFTWNIAAGAPQVLPGFRPTAHIIFDSRHINYHLLDDMGNWLYGSDTEQPHLPPIADFVDLIANWTVWSVTDNGDGTWTAYSKYDNVSHVESSGRFTIDEINARYLDGERYNIWDTPGEED